MENLLRPWILALAIASLGAAIAWLRGGLVAFDVLRGFEPEERSAAQIALERRAELGARFIELGALAQAISIVLLVFGADRAATEIRGAMCAHGVLASTSAGFPALGLGLGAAAAGLAWTQLHRRDLALRDAHLTKPKFIVFALLSPLGLAAAWMSLAFVRELDFGVVASCCSSSMDSAGSGARALGATAPVPLAASGAALLLALSAMLFAVRAPSPKREAFSGALGVLGVLLALPALVHFVSPHIYETPSHRCPFCLLHPPELAFGLPIYVAMIAAFFTSTHLALGALSPERSRRPALAALAALLALALALAAPILRYAIVTGTTLLGGAS